MLDPRSARSIDECQEIAEVLAGNYPVCLGWQACLEPLLPPVPAEVVVDGQIYRACMAFVVDEELGPHFVFQTDENELAEVLVSEIGFEQPFSDTARLWFRAFTDWRNGRTHQRRRPQRRI